MSISEPQKEDELNISYVDKIIKMTAGNTLIARCILFEDETFDKLPYLTMHSPMEVWVDYDGERHLTKWIPESQDDIFILPSSRVLNISTPEKMIGIQYNNGFVFDGDEHAGFTTDLIADIIH